MPRRRSARPEIAGTGIASTFSFYPTKNLFGLGDGGLIAVQRRGARGADPDAPLPRLEGEGRRSSTSATTRASTSSRRRRCGSSCAQLDGWTALRREAAARYAELGLGELCELPVDEPGHVYHLFVCRSPERDRIRAALTEAGIGNAQYYLPPLHLQPALRYLGYEAGSLPETERAAAENFSVPLWAGISDEQQERVVETVRAAVGVPSAADDGLPINRHRLRQLPADLAMIARGLVPRLPAPLRPGLPRYYEHYLTWEILGLVVALKLGVFVALRLLQPLVALRLHAGHVGRGARCHGRLAPHLPRLHALRRSTRRPCRARSGRSTGC